MGMKDLVRKITGKRRANTTRDAATTKDPNSAQPAAPSGKTPLTEEQLQQAVGGTPGDPVTPPDLTDTGIIIVGG
jgi:hypothetical protein